jgi:hypothetical protein
MNTSPPVSPDAAPAHALWVQLATRITTQPLHYRSGEEETAAASVASLFARVRELLEKHPHAAQFRALATSLLNDTLRAHTARWHGWLTEDKERRGADGKPVLRFRDERVRRLFRQELRELQPRLIAVQNRLAEMAGITEKPVPPRPAEADLGASLRAGIQEQVQINTRAPAGVQLATPDEINATEQADLLRRRIALETLHPDDQPRAAAELDAASKPSDKADARVDCQVHDVAGLAFSGGGIRSATFCLGVAQALARRGLLPQFDYLSTVSGGGYFGSFLSCALGTRQPGDKAPTTKTSAEVKLEDVFQRQQGIESGLLRHLRNHSKYLLHGGFLGRMRILGLMLSGVLWNLMIMLPLPLFAALLAYLAGPWLWGDAISANGPALPALRGSPAGQALLGLAVVFGAAWIALPGVQLVTHGRPPKSAGAIFRGLWENLALGLGLLTAAAGVLFLTPALFHGHEALRTWLAGWQAGGVKLEAVAGLLPASLTGVAGAALAALGAWLAPHWPRLRTLVVRLFILTGPLLLLFVFLLVGNRLGLARGEAARWEAPTVLWVALGLAVWDWLFVNINTLAPHRYYRNRLCECYLARRIPEAEGRKKALVRALAGERVTGRTEILKQVKLSDLGADLTAPYHLVNMTINAPTSREKNLRGRGGDFFLASREFYGSPLTGYARTAELEQADPHFDLGTAMAVSGAAASPVMGWRTLPHFRFLMTLFNVRLGYWLRHPGRPVRHRLLEGAGPWYFFREMLGRMDERSRYVYLSDGGHIENLGAYELLRRRCKFIVCVDGSQERGMECSDLVRLQRYAEIDLGVRLHFDTADLQIGPNGLSRAHAILVKIDYAPILPGHEERAADATPARRKEPTCCSDQLGWMLYVKLAMTGVEPAYVQDYRRENPDFPHQTTGDQIYEEEQFEAYRALGECAMDGMFREELTGPRAPRNVREWFQCLADNLLPDNDDAFRHASPPP